MPYRDGSLSSFPTSLDNFDITWPFGQDRINGTGAGRDDLEQAEHFNHLFDGALQTEKYIQNRVAGSIKAYGTRTEGGALSPTGALQMSVALYTLPVTGTGSPWYEYTLDIPTQFGSNPMYNWRFSIVPSVYLSTGQTASSIQGVATNTELRYSYLGALNSMPQLITMVMPATGQPTKYKLCIKPLALGENTLSLSGKSFSDFQSADARESATQNLGPGWITAGDDNAMAVAHYDLVSNSPGSLLALSSQGSILGGTMAQSTVGNAGIGVPATIPSTADHEVRFRPFEYSNAQRETSGVLNRVGFFVRWNGDSETPSFYCLTIGEQTMPTTGIPGTGFLYRVRNFDTFSTDVEYTAGILSSVTSSASLLGSMPIHWYSESGYTDVLYSLDATGDVIRVRESTNNGGSWTTKLSITDSSAQKLTSGRAGCVAFPLKRTDLLGKNNRNSRISAFDRISILVNSTEVISNFMVRTLFCLQGVPNTAAETESV